MATTTFTDDRLFTFKEVTEKYKVTTMFIYRKMKELGLDPIRIGTRSVRLTGDQLRQIFNGVEPTN